MDDIQDKKKEEKKKKAQFFTVSNMFTYVYFFKALCYCSIYRPTNTMPFLFLVHSLDGIH